jgi:hypothetical protein
MRFNHSIRRRPHSMLGSFLPAALAGIVLTATGCSFFQFSPANSPAPAESRSAAPMPTATVSASAPTPDPRVGLRGGAFDAAEAVWNLRVLSETKPSEKFAGGINSDLAFLGNYVIQGSFSGYQVWDITNPKQVVLKTAYFCPASQSDVSVYKNLLFVSGEDLSARVDCGAEGVKDTVSKDRLRGIRIFDISDINNPKNVGNVQTCRGSHTHSLLVDPKDPENVYVYVSGSGGVRSPSELAGCVRLSPDKDPNSALFRIEVIKVPLAHPEQAAIVTSPRIFAGLTAPAHHGETALDIAEHKKDVEAAKARGAYTAVLFGEEQVAPDFFIAGHHKCGTTALYEMILVAVLWASVSRWTTPPPGSRFAAFLLGYCTIRFIVDFMKPPFGAAGPDTLAVSLYLLVRIHHTGPARQPYGSTLANQIEVARELNRRPPGSTLRTDVINVIRFPIALGVLRTLYPPAGASLPPAALRLVYRTEDPVDGRIRLLPD